MKPRLGGVMFVRPALERGGAEKMLAFVANSLSEHPDVRKTWLVTTHSDRLAYDLSPGVEHLSLSEETPKLPLSAKWWKYARALTALRKLVRVLNPNAVCAFGVQYTLLCVLACWGLPARVVGAERGSPAHLGRTWRRLTGLVYSLADGMVFQLDSVRDCYPRVRRSAVIANPYISETRMTPAAVGARRSVVAAAFARWDDSKGVDVLLRAFHLLVGDHPELSLHLIGPVDGRARFEVLAQELDITSRVRFLDALPDVAGAVWDCRVFVLPSRHEGIPNVLLEVLGAGVPVVSCDCPPGGPRLLTANGERGLLVPVDDVEAMSTAIARIVTDDDLADRLSRSAPSVRTEFSPVTVRDRWFDFFDLLISQRQ